MFAATSAARMLAPCWDCATQSAVALCATVARTAAPKTAGTPQTAAPSAPANTSPIPAVAMRGFPSPQIAHCPGSSASPPGLLAISVPAPLSTATSANCSARRCTAVTRSWLTTFEATPKSCAASPECGVTTAARTSGSSRNHQRPSASTTRRCPVEQARRQRRRPRRRAPGRDPQRWRQRARAARQSVPTTGVFRANHHQLRSARKNRCSMHAASHNRNEAGAGPQRRFRGQCHGTPHAEVAAHDHHVSTHMFVDITRQAIAGRHGRPQLQAAGVSTARHTQIAVQHLTAYLDTQAGDMADLAGDERRGDIGPDHRGPVRALGPP